MQIDSCKWGIQVTFSLRGILMLQFIFLLSLGWATQTPEDVQNKALKMVCPMAKMQLKSRLNPSEMDADMLQRSEAIQEQMKRLEHTERKAIETLVLEKMVNCIHIPEVDRKDESPEGLGRQMAALMCLKMKQEMRLKIGSDFNNLDPQKTDALMTAVMNKTLSIVKSDQNRFQESAQKTMIQCIQPN